MSEENVNNTNIAEAREYLRKELGDRYEDIIEYEFGIELEKFIEWFIVCDEDGCVCSEI